MDEVFANASCVLVWLEPTAHGWAARTFAMICETNQHFSKLHDEELEKTKQIRAFTGPLPACVNKSTDSKWPGVVALLHLDWFWQVWTLQVSKSPVLNQ